MIKELGRLNLDDFKLMDAHVDKIFKNLDKDKNELATKQILEMGNTSNYFVREELGRRLAQYTGTGDLDSICAEMLEHRLYGIRATALFYFYYKHFNHPEIMIRTLEKTSDSVPWETETICFEMWKKAPEVMKEYMPFWAQSESEKKRAMSLHGMESIAGKNPQYILTFISRMLDDESEEVQKKISHILTQVGKMRPVQTYACLRRWLLEGDENRSRTIWQTLRKLISIYSQKSMKDKNSEFVSVSKRIAQEWKQDSDPSVVQMGNRLGQMLKGT
jgi:hypothetical protein